MAQKSGAEQRTHFYLWEGPDRLSAHYRSQILYATGMSREVSVEKFETFFEKQLFSPQLNSH